MSILLMIVAASLAPERFDLSCHGLLTSSDAGGSAERAFAMHVRVDLPAGRFCLDLCADGRPIAKIAPDRIILSSDGEGGGGRVLLYDRRSSRLHLEDRAYAGGKLLRGDAACDVSPFTAIEP